VVRSYILRVQRAQDKLLGLLVVLELRVVLVVVILVGDLGLALGLAVDAVGHAAVDVHVVGLELLLHLLAQRRLLGLLRLGLVAGAAVLLLLAVVVVGRVELLLGQCAGLAQTGCDGLDIFRVVVVLVIVAVVHVHGHADELEGCAQRQVLAILALGGCRWVDGCHGDAELGLLAMRHLATKFGPCKIFSQHWRLKAAQRRGMGKLTALVSSFAARIGMEPQGTFLPQTPTGIAFEDDMVKNVELLVD
jgi:hypothetical protein